MNFNQIRGLKSIWLGVLFYLFLPSLFAQQNEDLSPSEIHKLAERLINYSRDSCLYLLDLSSKKIDQIQDEALAKKLRAENNLRRGDYWSYSRLDSAKHYVEKAHAYYENHIDHKKLADIYVLMAQINRSLKRQNRQIPLEILPYFDSALVHGEIYKDPAFLSFIYYEKAISLQFEEKWEESFENALLSIKNAELSEDSLSMATSYFLMGRTYHHFGLFGSSESYIAKSVKYGKGISSLYNVIFIYANVLQEKNKSALALKNYKLALKLALEKKDTATATSVHAYIGQLHIEKNELEAAKDCYSSLKEILKPKFSGGYKTMLFIAQMEYFLGNEMKSISVLNSFSDIYNKGKIIPRNVDVYKQAADLHIALNQASEATHYYKKWGLLKDSLYSLTIKQQLSALEEMYLKERSKNEEIVLTNIELSTSRNQQAYMAGILIFVLLTGGGLVYYIRMKGLKENQKLKYSLKEKQIEQMINAQETERQRLARELHDGIGQSLAALKMKLQFDNNPKASITTVQRVDDICEEVRSLSHQMMPIVLLENGLVSAIDQLLEVNFSASPIETDFVSSGIENRLSDIIEINVYRITQELVSNIVKHSKATQIGLQLLKRGRELFLIVEDNGQGFNTEDKAKGIGLNNINNRLSSLGGTCHLQSSSSEGTYIHISIPISIGEKKKTA